jgi:3-keto-5-aminohexanoate cleavage enzyme
MQPLIITASCGRLGPGRDAGHTAADVAASVLAAYKAGATVAQVRAVSRPSEGSAPRTTLQDWIELRDRVREACDIVLHFGVAAMSVDERISILELGPNMASFLLGHHDLRFENGANLYAHRTREDNLRLAEAHLRTKVKPEFEVFQSGQTWNMRYLLERVAIPRPYWCTLFFGWPGGEWSPPTPEELLNRVKCLPDGALYTISIVGDEQTALASLAIHLGGHVRVGFGDYANYRPGVPGESNAAFVARIARLADDFSRPLATPAQAREVLGLT